MALFVWTLSDIAWVALFVFVFTTLAAFIVYGGIAALIDHVRSKRAKKEGP